MNDHLFAQIERLSDESLSNAAIESEVRRSAAIVNAADAITRIAMLEIKAAEIVSDYGADPEPYLKKFGKQGSLIEVKSK